jgi:hypothetical protein
MKAFIERKWDSEEERAASCFPKSWCKPIDVEDEAFGVAAMKYALSLGVDTLIPPGNYASFSFAVDHIDECLNNPLNDDDRRFLQQKLEKGFDALARPIVLRSASFNQQLCVPGYLLVEVGGHGNTLAYAIEGARFWADTAARALKNT